MFTLNLTFNGRRLLERAVEAQRELIEPLIDPCVLNPRREHDSADYLDCCDILRQLDEAFQADEEAEAEDTRLSALCGCFGDEARERALAECEPALDAWVNEGGLTVTQ